MYGKTLYCLVGPSGSGKTTLAEYMGKTYGLKQVFSYTDRAPRRENEEGHIFVTPHEFDSLGKMCAFTLYNGHRYGVTEDILEKSDIYVIDPYGVTTLKQNYYKPVVVVGLPRLPEEEVERRMLERGDPADAISGRLQEDRIKFHDYEKICDVVLAPGSVEEHGRALKAIMDKYNLMNRGCA